MSPTHSRSRLLAVVFAVLALLALSLAASAPAMAAPTVSIDDPSPQFEGDGGLGFIKFTVTLSNVPSEGTFVSYQTVALDAEERDGPNCGGGDYNEAFGLFFVSSSSSPTRDIYVTTCGDRLDEDDERFSVELHAADHVTITKPVGIAEILDDDPLPELELDNATVTEPDTNQTATATFDVRLSEPSGHDVTFNFAPTDTTAKGGVACGPAGVDYETTSGSLTIPAGALTPSSPLRVTICGDLLDEDDETFRLKLISVVNAAGTPAANGKIIDDDPRPALSINNRSLPEGNAAVSSATFTVSLSAVSGRSVSVDWTMLNGTAYGGSACSAQTDTDYVAGGGTLTIPRGAPSGTITVPVCGDRPDEPNETFIVALASPTNAAGTPQGIGTINDEDPLPVLLVSGALPRAEGHTGSTWHALPARLTDPRDGQPVDTRRGVTFGVVTGNGSASDASRNATGGTTCASAGADYKDHRVDPAHFSVGGTPHAISAGSDRDEILLEVCGDTTAERSEVLSIRANNVQNATVANPTSEFTILNDDGPALTIFDAFGSEGTTMTFKVKLDRGTADGGSGEEVRVNYRTRDDTAHADAATHLCNGVNGPSGNDYGRVAGTLVFPAAHAGSVQFKSITVPACADNAVEIRPEHFTVRLSQPDFVHLADGDGTGAIM